MLVNRWLITGSRCLLDHVVGPGEESRRHFEAERLGSLEVDHKIETGRAEVESAAPFGCVAGSGLPDTRTLSPCDPIFFYYTAIL